MRGRCRFGRPGGCADVGLLQVRACTLIPCGDGPAAGLAHPWRGTASRLPMHDVPAARGGARRAAVPCPHRWPRGRPFTGVLRLLPVTVRARRRATGCACKGVFVTLARDEGFPLALPSPRAPGATGRRTQENGSQPPGGDRRVQGTLVRRAPNLGIRPARRGGAAAAGLRVLRPLWGRVHRPVHFIERKIHDCDC